MLEWLRNFSFGVWAIVVLAVVSSVFIFTRPEPSSSDHAFWLFVRSHFPVYEPLITKWNGEHPEMRIEPLLLSLPAMERRLFSGFMSGTPMADLFEITQIVTARLISGPREDIGLRDLTDLLKFEGLSDTINPPSFSPWTLRGRIYGLPHDVHPVLLVYRSDLVEAAGIDVSEIETWEDFARVMGPLQRTGGKSEEDRYLLNVWHRSAAITFASGRGRFF
jgi:arabinosaccharide transport system substrate-binding protein